MEISVNVEQACNHSKEIKSVANYFTCTTLAPADNRTTITANQKGKDAYNTSQKLIDYFGDMLAIDANNIKSLGLAFKEIDELYSDLMDFGMTGPVFKQAE